MGSKFKPKLQFWLFVVFAVIYLEHCQTVKAHKPFLATDDTSVNSYDDADKIRLPYRKGNYPLPLQAETTTGTPEANDDGWLKYLWIGLGVVAAVLILCCIISYIFCSCVKEILCLPCKCICKVLCCCRK